MSGWAAADAAFWAAHFLAAVQTLRTRDPWFTARRRKLTALTAVLGLAGSLMYGYWAGAGFCAATLVLLAGAPS